MNGSRRPDARFWNGRSVFLTGHTGFVGGWLAFWLHRMGARLCGYSLAPPTQPNFFSAVGIDRLVSSTLGDVRDQPALLRAVADARPEVIIHLAAQPLVSEAFRNPSETFTVNVTGTLNVLEAACAADQLKSLVVFTTDKVYAEGATQRRFREEDPLGGLEPYALSKASAEFVVLSYVRSRLRERLAELGVVTVRAGNIIGGGDWARDRLVPDAVRAFSTGVPLLVRNPHAVRPWQHVLDALNGLLVVAEASCLSPGVTSGAWNLGPLEAGTFTVADVADRLVRHWGADASWRAGEEARIPESAHLEIDSRKAAEKLGIRTSWTLDEAIAQTMGWYRAFHDGGDMFTLSNSQIERHQGCTSRHAEALMSSSHP